MTYLTGRLVWNNSFGDYSLGTMYVADGSVPRTITGLRARIVNPANTTVTLSLVRVTGVGAGTVISTGTVLSNGSAERAVAMAITPYPMVTGETVMAVLHDPTGGGLSYALGTNPVFNVPNFVAPGSNGVWLPALPGVQLFTQVYSAGSTSFPSIYAANPQMYPVACVFI